MSGVSVRLGLGPSLVLLQLCVASAGALAETSEKEALLLLQRIANAARQQNYDGTFVYQHGDRSEISRITHYADRSGEFEKLETLDGPKRVIIRTDTEIWSFDIERREVKKHKRVPGKTFPGLLPDQLAHLTEYYTVRKGGPERIAGVDSQALMLDPRDALRYGHKLWCDVKTGLLLRARMLNEKSQPVEQIAFTQLIIGTPGPRPKSDPGYDANDGSWTVIPEDPATETPTGWVVTNPPAGFKLIMEMKRPNPKSGGKAPVAHLVYSDGLAAVSVFIEPLAGARKFQEGLSHQGAVSIYTRPLSEQLVTALGEAPAATVEQMAKSVSPRGQ